MSTMPQPPDDRSDTISFEVTAPGRVNLIGEHTDYNDGFVLPMAIERSIRIRVKRRDDSKAVFASDRGGVIETATIDLDSPVVPAGRGWAEYPAGVIAGYLSMGYAIPGFDAFVTSDLPAGGGLSSSAALETATAIAIERLCRKPLPALERAVVCQSAEHSFAGVPCGIMDQLAVGCGREGHALLIDCRTRDIRHVPLGDAATVLVIHSGVKHSLADGEYAIRRAECRSAAVLMNVSSLRDATRAMLETAVLPDTERKRARHVISENERVIRFVEALARPNMPAAGRLMLESHASLASDYEVSCAELDTLVGIASSLPGVYGCRLTGGGFGGCVVAVVENAEVAAVMRAVASRYKAATGIDPAMFTTRAAAGP